MSLYRNGTYIAFHANNTPNPTESDIKYFNTLKMWKVRDDNDFSFINSHEKTGAVRDTSQQETLKRALRERLNSSKNMILIISETTRLDTDWVPFEITHAVDICKIPIIATYPGYNCILAPNQLSNLWPHALKDRITNGTAKVIHVPFKQSPLTAAVYQFNLTNQPNGGDAYYTKKAYVDWGLINN